jgi:voltage-gated potassium channel Kch
VRILGALVGVVLIVLVLLDTFETILQPRRVTHRFRFARFFYRWNWTLWASVARRIPRGKRREAFLALFGPLSLLALFLTWGIGLILGFALLHASAATALHTADTHINFFTYLYLSGTTFFTLGYGDVTPADHFGRVLAVIESGLGFAFLAVVIAYLPGITQAFSRRETTISLLDARAGSPPTAAQVLVRAARADTFEGLQSFLVEWEQWSAELLESHLSFPVLIYFRSQHDNQSWLAALTCMLDTTALLMAGMKGCNPYRAQLTFAMARHAAVDLAVIFHISPQLPAHDRLPADQLQKLHRTLGEAGVSLRDDAELAPKLAELRAMYEPFVNALAVKFLLTLPPIAPPGESIDNWQRSPGMPRAPGIANLPIAQAGPDDHFG